MCASRSTAPGCACTTSAATPPPTWWTCPGGTHSGCSADSGTTSSRTSSSTAPAGPRSSWTGTPAAASRRLGVGPDHPDGSEVAYFLTRGPLHAGRYTATSLLSAPPLAQRRFTATIYAPADSPRALPRRLRRTSAASQPRINSGIAETLLRLVETWGMDV